MIRFIFVLIAVVTMGCDSWPPKEMYAPTNVPPTTEEIHPWIATLLSSNTAEASRMIAERVESDEVALAPLAKRMSRFTPCQICFSRGIGHVRCVGRYVNQSTSRVEYNAIYLVEPLAPEKLESRLRYFEPAVRPLMSAFLSRFAGSGEEMMDTAGQFTYDSWPTAEAFGYTDMELLGKWKDATLLYHALNGDGVFIQPNGATAWRVLETHETIPLADTFTEFIELYAAFRATHDVFDSWTYREFIAGRTKR